MPLLNPEHQQQFLQQAIVSAPEECAAILVKYDGIITLVPIANIARRKQEDLAVSKSDIADIVGDGQLLAFVHSHTNGNTEPSMVDRAGCEAMGVPWAILCLPQQQWIEFEAEGYVAPLRGRDWHYPTLDCYALIRDAYKQFGICLPDFEREPLVNPQTKRFVWHNEGWNRFETLFKDAGFYEVQAPRIYDLLVMRNRCINLNHAGLLINGGYVLHHELGRKSDFELWDGDIRQSTGLILRHSLLSLEVASTTVLDLYSEKILAVAPVH